jgi:hypothetical protein
MLQKKIGSFRYPAWRVSIIFFVLTYIAGCVPTPPENGSTPPKVTNLRSYFISQETSKEYLWHFFTNSKDSTYLLTFNGIDQISSSDGFFPISQFTFSDTLKKDSLLNEAYISDSLIEWYFGKSSSPVTSKLIFLRDTLQVGAVWTSADNFITSNGTPISIKAEVLDYYLQTPSGGKIYNNVFLVSYTSTVKGTQIPLEPQYKNGARIDIYFASGIGEILEIAKDTANETLWTNELVETRNR